MSSINQKYLEIVLAYLSVLEEKELQLTQFNGKDAYLFHCPHCTKFVHSIKGKQRKTAKLIRTGGNSGFSDREYSTEYRNCAVHNCTMLDTVSSVDTGRNWRPCESL